MKPIFLCGTHRLELARNPKMAEICCQNGLDTGFFFFEQQMWKEAVRHLGLALETAEILMTKKVVRPKNAIKLFTSSALLLLDAFRKLGYEEQCQNTYCMATKRLTRELSYDLNEKEPIIEYLEDLYRHVQNKDSCAYQPGGGEAYRYDYLRTVLH